MQWGCPVLTTEGFSPELMALVMPKVFVEKLGLLPLGWLDREFFIWDSPTGSMHPSRSQDRADDRAEGRKWSLWMRPVRDCSWKAARM